jgi:hypothetical protein
VCVCVCVCVCACVCVCVRVSGTPTRVQQLLKSAKGAARSKRVKGHPQAFLLLGRYLCADKRDRDLRLTVWDG